MPDSSDQARQALTDAIRVAKDALQEALSEAENHDDALPVYFEIDSALSSLESAGEAWGQLCR